MEISGKSFHINLRLDNMGSQIWTKVFGIGHRILGFVRMFPTRTLRIFKHLWKGIQSLFSGRLHRSKSNVAKKIVHNIGFWWLDLLFHLLEWLGFTEIYETLMDFIKFNTRPLYKWEIDLAKSVFGNSIDYRRVRIDEYSVTGPRQKKFCYVSFYIINSWGPMQNSIFIHEMTHIWQFEKVGAIYIPHALKAQQSKMGYNYGGAEALKDCQEKGKRFLSFNFEQQGDIISDYYRIRDGYKPHWGNGNRHDLPVYESFIDQLRES